MVQLNVLGPLQAIDDEGREVALRGRLERRLLAYLTLHAGETLEADDILEVVWKKPATAAAKSTLQSHVANLRATLEPRRQPRSSTGLIRTVPQGYLLTLRPTDSIDAHAFEELVASAGQQVKRGEYRSAGGEIVAAQHLWRGSPFPELADSEVARAEIARLEAIHAGLLECGAEARLGLGEHDAVIPTLESLTARFPFREGIWEKLVVALYRSGRQRDALATCHRIRTRLVEELGVEPGAGLRHLELAVLEQRAELDWVPPTDRAAGAPGRVFFGREAELGRIRVARRRAEEGDGSVVLVIGEPGMGKTSLAARAADQATAEGWAVAWGRCTEALGAPSLWPWVQILRLLVSTIPAVGTHLDGTNDTARRELTRLAPDLFAARPRPVAPEAILDGVDARFRLFDAIAGAIVAASSESPLLVILDDLQWADPQTTRMLVHLAGEVDKSSVVVLGLSRQDSIGTYPIADEPSSGLPLGPARERILLPVLDDRSIASVIEEVSGATPAPGAVDSIRRRTGGNPLFVTEVARTFGPTGVTSLDTPASPGVRELLRRQFSQLDGNALRLIELAAVSGPVFDVATIATAGGVATAEVVAALDAAAASGVCVPQPGALRWAFSHDLMRDTVLDELSATRRAQLHYELAGAMERSGVPAATVAHHYVASAAVGGASKAVMFCRRAASDATDVTAYEDAVAFLEAAVRCSDLDPTVEPAAQADLRLELVDACWRAADADRARTESLAVCELARRHQLVDHLARGAIAYGGAAFALFFVHTGAPEPTLVTLLDEALSRLPPGDSALRAMVLGRLGMARYWDVDGPQSADALSRESVAIARRLRDADVLRGALINRLMAGWSPDNLEERLAIPAELRGLTRDLRGAYQSLSLEIPALFEVGDIRAVDRSLSELEIVVDERGRPLGALTATAMFKGARALLAGQFTRAEDLIFETFKLGQRSGDPDALATLGAQLGLLRRDQGRLDELMPALESQVATYPALPSWRIALALAYVELGRLDDARRTLGRPGLTLDLPRDLQWLNGMAMLCEVASAIGEEDETRMLYDDFLPYAGRNVVVSSGTACWGASDRYLGLLAARLGKLDAAQDHLRAAVGFNDRMGAVPWSVRSRCDLARTLARARRRNDARELVVEALETASSIGMTFSVLRIDDLLTNK
ncbi:MAG: hypothetical protein NVS3B12_03620 [Acidimicrobiales bacterium]